MALRGTLTHWKTRMLAVALGIKPCFALGILEALWHTTAELAPSGNIGRLPNEAIAMEMFYDGDADELIAALLKSKHLEVHPEHRLIIHDWVQHSDHNTKRKVERRGESMFANDGSPQVITRKEKSSQVMTRHKSIPVPEPEPEPVPEPVPVPVKKEQKTSLRQAQSDPRHVPFRLACETYAKYKGVTFVWDGGEAKQLSALLAASPELTLGVFQQCLNHRAKSQVPHGERPREWLGTIFKYQEGPLNEFGKPQGAGNGHRNQSKTGGNVDAARQALAILAEAERVADVADEMQSPEGCGGESGDLSHLRDGSIEL